MHKWKLGVEVMAFNMPKDQRVAATPLKSVKFNLIIVWNPANNEFFIDGYEQQ